MNNIIVGKLTPAEHDVMFYSALGLTAEETAEQRGTTHNVVKGQRCTAYPKLGAYTLTEAVARLLVVDREFFDKVRDALNDGDLKPDGIIHGRGHERVLMLKPILSNR